MQTLSQSLHKSLQSIPGRFNLLFFTDPKPYHSSTNNLWRQHGLIMAGHALQLPLARADETAKFQQLPRTQCLVGQRARHGGPPRKRVWFNCVGVGKRATLVTLFIKFRQRGHIYGSRLHRLKLILCGGAENLRFLRRWDNLVCCHFCWVFF